MHYGGFSNATIASEHNFNHLIVFCVHYQNIMQVKGKQIKDYIIGDVIVTYQNMHLLNGTTTKGQSISILMIDKSQMEQSTFVQYVNMLQQNVHKVHPRYYQPIQSSNNIYVVLEKIQRVEDISVSHQEVLASLIELYKNIGQYKVELGQLFINNLKKIVYLPFYKHVQTSSKFYAQFHNKSILGQLFAKVSPLPNKNRSLEIFLQNIDTPDSYQTISKMIQLESKSKPQEYPSIESKDNKNVKSNVFFSKAMQEPKNHPSYKKEETKHGENMLLTKMMEEPKKKQQKISYPSIKEDEQDDEEILELMAQANVNNNMKENAAMFQRQSVKQFEQKSDKQMHSIMEMAQSKMPVIKKANKSQQFKTKMEVKVSKSKVQGDEFDTYFTTYYESFRFLKKAVKVFLTYYKGGFSGIISAYLTALVLTLRKAYMIQDLECGIDIFQLEIDMANVNVRRYISIVTQGLSKQAKMIAELRVLLENCQMPYKTYAILAPFLEEDLGSIDMEQLQSFTFFFMTALIKGRERSNTHYLYLIEVMYILLHRNYEIAFFESDFPKKWDPRYFDDKMVMIQAIFPSWSID